MTLLSKFLIPMLGFFSCFIFPLTSMEESNPSSSINTESERRIGVELETSAIKGAQQETILGFTIKTPTSTWNIELDTRDFSDEESALHNMEIKTIGGYTKEVFLSMITVMTETLKYFYKTVQEKNNVYTLKRSRVEKMLKEIGLDNFNVAKIGNKKNPFKITKNMSYNNKIVEPQITYQISLSEVPRIFNRIAELGERNAIFFCNSLKDNYRSYGRVTNFELDAREARELEENSKEADEREREIKNHTTKTMINKIKVLQIYKIFNELIYPRINHSSPNVKGFSYLFLYYWASIFNNNNYATSYEPGLKPYLTVMSRLPISDIYKYGLNEEEKHEFNNIFDEIIFEIGKDYKMRKYRYYDDRESTNKISMHEYTLDEWYRSIVEPKEGEVDFLSPPPHMPKGYAMGLYRWESTNNPVLEVRGYSIMKYGHEDINIDNIEVFLRQETNWFFDNGRNGS